MLPPILLVCVADVLIESETGERPAAQRWIKGRCTCVETRRDKSRLFFCRDILQAWIRVKGNFKV